MLPEPSIFVSHLQDVNKKLFFIKFFACYFLTVYLHYFSKIKVIQKSQNSRNQGFSYYFCLMIERSFPLTNGSKNIRIRICNTGFSETRAWIPNWGKKPGPVLRPILLNFFPGFFWFFSCVFIQHCFICRPSDSAVSEDAGIELGLMGLWHWQSDALTSRLE